MEREGLHTSLKKALELLEEEASASGRRVKSSTVARSTRTSGASDKVFPENVFSDILSHRP